MHKRYLAVKNIVRKGEIACNKHFLLFSQCFLPYMVLIFHFKCTLKFRMQFVPVRTSLKICCLLSGNGLNECQGYGNRVGLCDPYFHFQIPGDQHFLLFLQCFQKQVPKNFRIFTGPPTILHSSYS